MGKRYSDMTDEQKAKAKERQQRFYAKNPGYQKALRQANPLPREYYVGQHLQSRYGISSDEYLDLWRSQQGVCATCFQPEPLKRKDGAPRALSVDHDHSTGRVRGLLCGNCNRAIGLLKDNSQIAYSIGRYLELGDSSPLEGGEK